jgi:hypothetical protein
LSAIRTSATRDFARIFRVIWLRCTSTVISLKSRSAAICLFGRPVTTSANTSRSRTDREAKRAFSSATAPSFLAPNAVALDCDLDRVEQLLLTQGLRQEFDGAQLHCPHGHGNVAAPADEYDRKPHARLGYSALELESARPWQPDVEHDASGRVGPSGLQKFLNRSERLRLQPERGQQIVDRLDRLADRHIVVDDVYDGTFGRGWRWLPSQDASP